MKTNHRSLSEGTIAKATLAFSQEFVSIFVRTNAVVAHFLKYPKQGFAYKFLFYKKLYLLFPSLQFFLTKSLFHLQATSVHACLLYLRWTAASILNKIAPICEQDSPNLRRKQSNKDGTIYFI